MPINPNEVCGCDLSDDSDSETDAPALWRASDRGHLEVARILLEAGAEKEPQGGGSFLKVFFCFVLELLEDFVCWKISSLLFGKKQKTGAQLEWHREVIPITSHRSGLPVRVATWRWRGC